MKLALLVALATVAAVSSYRPSVHSVVYKPGEQYVYHYKGQILTGIPKSSKIYSGLIIDSIILLQFQQDNKVAMKLENIKLYKVDHKITNLPSESLPESEMIRLTGEQEKLIVEKLLLPIKFRYEEGEVRELQKEVRDKYWSVNIKKGILSIFQVTLKEKNSLSSDSSIYYDPTMSRIKTYGSRSYGSSSQSFSTPTTKSNSVYTVKETDISGNCETKYTIIGDKTHLSSSSSKMFVTAVRNFDTCLTRPFHIEGLFQGVPTSSAERELIQPTVHTDYVITGDRSHFMIQEATRRGKYFVFVNGLEGGDLSSYVYQRLWLKKAESISSPVHLVSPKTDYRGLQMVIPKASLLPEKENYGRTDPQYESFVYRKSEHKYPSRKAYESEEEEFYQDESISDDINDDVNNIIPVVEENLKQLTECVYTDTADKKCSDILMQLTIVLREATKEQMKTICNRYIKREHSRTDDIVYRFSEILLDILPTLPTPDAAEVLIELIGEGHITPLRGSLLINTMSLIAKPTPTVIKQLLGLFKEMKKDTTSTSLNDKTLLRQSVLLAVGTLTHRLLVTMRSQGKPVPELITFFETVSQEMKRLLEEASGKGEKTLVLRAMGNMGARENIITLKSIIERRQGIEDETRVNAIHALRRVAKEFKKQVTPILMGVFMDTTEETLIRQAAFLILMKSNPSYATLQMMAHRANYEKSLQIKTLVYTNLINLAYYTSHQPEHKTLTKNSRLVLKTINPVYVGFYDSMTVFVNKFSEEYDLGVALSATKLKSKQSGIPEVIKTTLEGTMFGKHRKLFEAGAEGRAFISLLRKIVGPHGLLSEVLKGRVSLEDILKPIVKSDMGGVEHKILEIMNKMRFEFPRNKDLYANWYVRFLENELQYVTLTENNYGEITRKLMQWIPDILMKLRSGTTFDVIKSATHQSSLTVATCFGIPLHLNHSMYGIVKVEGAVKVTNLPTDFTSLWSEYRRYSLPQSFEQLRRSPFNIPDLKLELDVKPVVDVSHYITFSTDLRWLNTGVGTETYVKAAKPFRLTAELNKPDSSLSVKYFPTKQTMKTLHARAVPILFANYVPTTPSRLPYLLQVKELTNDEIVKPNPFRFEFECGMTGHDIEIKGLYSMCGPRWCPIMPLFGKQEIIIVTKPKSNMEFLELKVKVLKNNFEFEGIPSHLPTEELYGVYEQEDSVYERESVNYRTASRHSALPADEFESVTIDPIFSGETPIKRQLRVTLRPSTRQVPALKSQVTWFMSRNYWLNQLNLQVIRAAHQDMPDWKVITNTVINTLSWYPEERYIGERGEYLTKTDLILNINGNLKIFKLKIVPGSPFNFEEEFNRHTLLPVYDLPVKNTLKYKYTMELDFPEINNKAMKVITLIDDAIKYMFYDKLTVDLPLSAVPKKLVASIELLPWWEKMHIIVKNPRENLYVANVPFYWNPFLPTHEKIKVHNHYAWNYYKQVDDNEESFEDLHIAPYQYTPLLTKGDCKINFLKQHVRTFDGLRYSIKPTLLKLKEGCSMLTTQDCSKNGLFSMHISGPNAQNWVTKVHLPQADIEIEVVENVLRPIMVNGEAITIRQPQVYTIPSQAVGSSVLHEIEIQSSDKLAIRAKELGVIIRINRLTQVVDVNVAHTSLLWGNICGLCGNNNQDPSDDLDLPSSNRSSSLRPYYLNHLIPSDTCRVESPVVSADYCKKTTLLTVRRYDNETPMTCTSERKIVQCAPGCKPSQVRSVKTCFRCQSESGQSLARRSYYQPASVWELEDTSLSCDEFSERVEVPTLCEPLY